MHIQPNSPLIIYVMRMLIWCNKKCTTSRNIMLFEFSIHCIPSLKQFETHITKLQGKHEIQALERWAYLKLILH